jgi:hypothetical protein
MVGAAACALVAPETAGAAFALAVPVAWAGLGGAVVNAIRDEDDVGRPDGLVVPPEMAGFRDLIRLLVPVAVSTVGALCILALREQPGWSMVVRCMIGLALYLGLLRWWIVHRIDILARWRSFSAGARA